MKEVTIGLTIPIKITALLQLRGKQEQAASFGPWSSYLLYIWQVAQKPTRYSQQQYKCHKKR